MSRTKTYEEKMLGGCRALLDGFSTQHEQQLLVLEALASLNGGFSFKKYCTLFDHHCSNAEVVVPLASKIKEQLEIIDIPVSIAISILSREPLSVSEQKKTGAFYTDFRLSQLVGIQIKKRLTAKSDLADIAAGTGILLAGACECYAKKYPESISQWVASHVYAYDLSPLAIRGTIAALSCYLSDISQIRKLASHCFVEDSLLVKKPSFDIVVGNPPWGKIKLSRHAFSLQGNKHHIYGGSYAGLNKKEFETSRAMVVQYARIIKKRFDLIGKSEPDMYMAFLQEGLNCLKKGGMISILIPAGFIRSQGMEKFRRKLFGDVGDVSIVLLNNKARFFSIDTRFKFLLVSGTLLGEKSSTWMVSFSQAAVSGRNIKCTIPVHYTAYELQQVRKDLSIPECSTKEEKQLFEKLCANGAPMSEFLAEAKMAREIDMTLDREKFTQSGKDNVPLVEGRMVQAFRFGAKSYVSGEGRKAKWIPTCENIQPQFYVRKEALSGQMMNRVNVRRAGFCDIAGQTNERAMMSAVIPNGVVCGNKVPTILFGGCDSDSRLLLWVGVTNSFVFDWVLRRVLTTTVNMFLLNGLPFPKIAIDSKLAKAITGSTKELSELGRSFYSNNQRMSHLRAQIDAAVANAYGLNANEIRLIMDDFPLLDRKQPSIRKERRSTVTKDLLLSYVCTGAEKKKYETRVAEAVQLGAMAYIPYEMRSLTKGGIQ